MNFSQFPTRLKNYKLFRETGAYSWKLHVITVFSRRRKYSFRTTLENKSLQSYIIHFSKGLPLWSSSVRCGMRYYSFPAFHVHRRDRSARIDRTVRDMSLVTIVPRARAHRRSPFSLFHSRGPVVAWQTLCTNHFLRAHLCHIACVRQGGRLREARNGEAILSRWSWQ